MRSSLAAKYSGDVLTFNASLFRQNFKNFQL